MSRPRSATRSSSTRSTAMTGRAPRKTNGGKTGSPPVGRRFAKGNPGGPGRPAGTPNKATLAVREVCAAIVEDPAYRKKLRARALAGDLAPAVETMLWYYRYGKPKETVALLTEDPFAALDAAVDEANRA